MPYIDKELRDKLDDAIEKLSATMFIYANESTRAGMLNYTISKLLRQVYRKPNYRQYNEIMGLLTCVQQEYYRRLVGPYEDSKMEANGDVF